MTMRDRKAGALQSELNRLRVLSDAVVDGLAFVCAEGLIVEANLSLGAMAGCDPRSLVGLDVGQMLPEEHRASLADLIAAETTDSTIEVALAGPLAVGVELHLRRIEIADTRLAMLTFHDLRARRSAEKEIGRRARYDPLTGLRNRLDLNQALQTDQIDAGRYGSTFAVLCLDLDGFKDINDSHGHAAGDEALRVVARRLREVTRETDRVFRLGGDEFVILQAHAAQTLQSGGLADRIVASVGQPFFIGDVPLTLGISIGIAHFPGHGGTVEEVMHNADAALYKAKREGKNTHRFFEPSLDQALQHRRAIEAELMHAIDRGELDLLYQPQLDVASGAVLGLDARLSWHSSRLGIVPSSVFVPIAEQAGLMTALGEWSIHEACRQATTWPRPLGIAVTVSLFQIKSSDITRTVGEALRLAGLLPSRLRVDVSETTWLSGGRIVGETLARLKACGVRLGLDDVGSGTSSIAALDGGIFDLVKLSAALSRDASATRRLSAIVSAARAFHIPVAATGVPCVETRERVIAAGVAMVEGDVVSPPRSIAHFAPFVGAASPAGPRGSGDVRALETLHGVLSPFRPADRSVLVVDDSDIVGEALAAMLDAFGFTNVQRAMDGAAAWELLLRHKFDLVISDWNMAPVSGIELLGRIRAEPGLRDVRFLMLTANARVASRIVARDAGVDGFLVKPFRPDALASKILDVFSGEARLDEAV